MADSNSVSTSVTLRIPNEILQMVDSKADLLGRNKRSEVIVNLLRKSLNQPIPGITTTLERNEKLEQEVSAIKSKFSEFDEILEVVRQRFATYDNDIEILRNSLTENLNKILSIETKMESLSNINENSKSLISDQNLGEIVKDSFKPVSEQLSLKLDVSVSDESLNKIEKLESINPESLQFNLDDNNQSFILPLELLAVRLGVQANTLRTTYYKYKNKQDGFTKWIIKKDPNNIPWKYVSHLKGYIPDSELTDAQRVKLIEFLYKTSLAVTKVNVSDSSTVTLESQEVNVSSVPSQILLSGRGLATRLNVPPSMISNHKKKDTPESFLNWSRSHDPEKLGWQYEDSVRQYISVP